MSFQPQQCGRIDIERPDTLLHNTRKCYCLSVAALLFVFFLLIFGHLLNYLNCVNPIYQISYDSLTIFGLHKNLKKNI